MTVRVYPTQLKLAAGQERGRPTSREWTSSQRTERAAIGGVADAAAAYTTPLSSDIPNFPVELEGHPFTPGQPATLFRSGAVTPDYFKILRTPPLAGRLLTEADGEKSTEVAPASAATAANYWPGEYAVRQNASGSCAGKTGRTVVGVVGNVRRVRPGREGARFHQGSFLHAVFAIRRLGSTTPYSYATLDLAHGGATCRHVASELLERVAERSCDLPVSEAARETIVTYSVSPSRSLRWLFVKFRRSGPAPPGGHRCLWRCYLLHVLQMESTRMGVRMAFGATPGRIFGS